MHNVLNKIDKRAVYTYGDQVEDVLVQESDEILWNHSYIWSVLETVLRRLIALCHHTWGSVLISGQQGTLTAETPPPPLLAFSSTRWPHPTSIFLTPCQTIWFHLPPYVRTAHHCSPLLKSLIYHISTTEANLPPGSTLLNSLSNCNFL